ncbi:MAG: DUF3999 family protein [Phycisphaerae bacterium]|nr:DUF3999 family protein [Phycisphaerae bacterium]
MKRNFKIWIFIVIAAAHLFGMDMSKWKSRCDINFDKAAGKYYRFSVTPEIYDAGQIGLSDIRLIGADGGQIPYLIARSKDITTKEAYSLKVINRVVDSVGNSLVTLDFGQQNKKNEVEVITSGNNFRRAVKIEGSNDNVTFYTIVARGYVFAIDSTAARRFGKVEMPVNDYRYLRVTVEPMVDEKDAAIAEVRTYNIKKESAQRKSVEMALLSQREDEKNRVSVYEYDIKYRNLPVKEIELQVQDDSFYRYVTVDGRDAATRKIKIDGEDNRERYREIEESWMPMASGAIYRYITERGNCENLKLPVSDGQKVYRYLRITIKNYDDRPIEINDAIAKIIPHRVLFEPGQSDTAVLYLGANGISSPQYDLRYKVKNVVDIVAGDASLGQLTDNPTFSEHQNILPWSERHRILLFGILGIIVVALGGVIIKSLKSIGAEKMADDSQN